MSKPIRRIHFIEYNARINTLALTRVFPKYGTPLLAAIMKEKGYDVAIFLEGVSDMSFERMSRCDAVCFPVFAPALNKVKECALRFRRERPDIPVITGGPHAACFTDDVLGFCDYAVRCEGDEVLPELIERLSSGAGVRDVKGISFLNRGAVVHNPDRVPPRIPSTIPDLTLIEGFKRATMFRRHEIVNTLQTSRGCKFGCSFCPTKKLFGGSYRNRDIDSTVADIKSKLKYNPLFFVVDNSFLSNRERTRELLKRLVREDLGAHYIIFERHEIGRDSELLKLMWEAGVRCLIIGIESLANENLDAFHKRQKRDDVLRSLDNILRHGIHVIGTFVMGADGDTVQSAREMIDFIRKTRISLNLFILHDLYDDERADLMIPLNRRFKTYYQKYHPADTSFFDYMTGSFATYFPKKMKPSSLQKCIIDVYREVYTTDYILKYMFSPSIFVSLFGIAHGFSIRRMNDMIAGVVESGYMDYLKEIEKDLYDANEVIVEKRLRALKGLPLPPPVQDQVDFSSYRALTALGLLPGIVRMGIANLRGAISPPNLAPEESMIR
jgi:radical SAM superfamily enzyme YgiQ (UPF0313 family)